MPRAKDPSEPHLNMEAPYICPECKAAGKGKDAEFDTYQRRYHHRRNVHGIQPKKPGQWQKVKAKSKSLVKAETNGHLKKVREHDAPVQPQISIELFAYASGRFESLLLDLATKHDLPPKQFARGCFEYLLHSTGR